MKYLLLIFIIYSFSLMAKDESCDIDKYYNELKILNNKQMKENGLNSKDSENVQKLIKIIKYCREVNGWDLKHNLKNNKE